MLVHNKVELVAFSFSVPGRGIVTVVLDFDYVFFKGEADVEEAAHYVEGKGDVVSGFAGVADKDCAVFIRL